MLAVVFLVGEQYYILTALDQSSFLFIAGEFVLMLEMFLKVVDTLKSISFLLEMLFICLLFSICTVFSLYLLKELMEKALCFEKCSDSCGLFLCSLFRWDSSAPVWMPIQCVLCSVIEMN